MIAILVVWIYIASFQADKTFTLAFSSHPSLLPKNHHRHKASNNINIILHQTASSSSPEKKFGAQSYWETSYAQTTRTDSSPLGGFSWYCTWQDLFPFWRELVPLSSSPRILLPGVGDDPTLIDMYESGYTNLAAFDYAPAALDRCRDNMTIRNNPQIHDHVRLDVADARDLKDSYATASFDAILDKGTLDSVFLIGGSDKVASYQNVLKSVVELGRVTKPGGVVVSVTAVAVDAIGDAFEEEGDFWIKVRDTREGVYITDDGFASIDVDAAIMAWRRKDY